MRVLAEATETGVPCVRFDPRGYRLEHVLMHLSHARDNSSSAKQMLPVDASEELLDTLHEKLRKPRVRGIVSMLLTREEWDLFTDICTIMLDPSRASAISDQVAAELLEQLAELELAFLVLEASFDGGEV